ncbi:Linalool synthase, chloroplastic [Hordeum vulgare]|uniref:S-(+)-linalool synthase, chloroplastic-like n=1 Tax=Hordeum vulgare subsp. vulgare TaxID=112509 RepID=UPI000B48547E|nr:S-(+)-linalool synthase, chloroplastic-like [Hordeum vulgare subsp. vulgare]KAE8794704.1 Linalool synthase, chloroplastic [Hordeum vulgare]
MAAAHVFFSFSVQPLHHSASPVAGNGGRSGPNRAFFRPSTVICPGREPASHELSHDFDFQESLTNVQALLHQHPTSRRGLLTTVDHLKRLCIDHYFQDEIDTIMGSCTDLIHSNDLLDATLSLRLMREAGYYVSADDVLRKFKNDNGEFNIGLSKDIRGLLSLQDMSHLNVGESSLYKANEFSSKHLRNAIKYLEPNLGRYVRRSLDHPYHVSQMQYKARHHLSYLQNMPTRNMAIENLALAEFTIKKLQHQWEMQEVKRWWMDLGLAQEIPAARDQVLKWYMWPMTVLEGFSFSRYRIEITKVISMVYIVDDIFDLVATQEELSLFNEAIKMWDLAAVDSLPSYMISCYKAIYTITCDIADMVRKEHGVNPINHLKKEWATLFDGFVIEGKWLSTDQIPTSEDYLRNGIITSGAPLLFMHLFFMLGHELNEGKNDDIHRVISYPAKIMRLWDDMGTAKDESQNGLDGSYKELYQRENPRGDAKKHMLEMIGSEWEGLNRVCFCGTKSTLSHSFITASLNFARMVRVMYGYDNEQKLPVLEDYTKMLLF